MNRFWRDVLALVVLGLLIAGATLVGQRAGTRRPPLLAASCDADVSRDGYQINFIFNDHAHGCYYSFQVGGLSHPLKCVAHLGSLIRRDQEVEMSGAMTLEELEQIQSSLRALGFARMQSGDAAPAPGEERGPSYSLTVLEERHSHGISFSAPPTPEHAELIHLMTRPTLAPGRCYRQLLTEYGRRCQ